MKDIDNLSPDDQPAATDGPRRLYRFLPLALIIGAIIGAVILVKTAPRPARQQPPPLRSLARVIEPEPNNQPVIVRTMGVVIPAQEIDLEPLVGGEVVWVHPQFEEGARYQEGEVLVRIDPADYEIALAMAEAQVARASYEYELELGRQDVARREWKLIREDRPASPREETLALRKPQLENVEAGLASARAAREQAELNLERTHLKSPFNALLRQRLNEIGSVVNPQEAVATLVGTDAFWVQVAIPVDRLGALENFEGPATIRLAGNNTTRWRGTVIRLLGDLEQSGRMARLLVAVPQPLDQYPAMPLLLGSYVHVDLEGRQLEQVMVLPRSALREEDRVWLATAEDTLEIRTVEVAWRDNESVYISGGLAAGERVIVTDLAIPVAGMPLIVQDNNDRPAEWQGTE